MKAIANPRVKVPDRAGAFMLEPILPRKWVGGLEHHGLGTAKAAGCDRGSLMAVFTASALVVADQPERRLPRWRCLTTRSQQYKSRIIKA
jgi:hypothetical protein